MIDRLIHKFTRKRHYWRQAGFDELSEIYTSMMMRSLGFSLMGIFVPIYLYTNGFSIQDIFLFFAFVFFIRAPLSYIIALVVGRIGPKHSIAVSTIILILFLMMLLSISAFQWPLIILALPFSAANGLFFIAYHTDFSKIKHVDHGGKELGYSVIFERLGGAAGPLVGGAIASLIVPEATIVFAIFVLLASLIPLFLTSEPVKRHQHIVFKGFPARKYTRNFIAMCGLNIEHIISVVLWPLFIAIVIFQDDIYAKVGAVVAIGTLASIVSARFFGGVIDKKKGGVVLRYGVFFYGFLHLLRPFISTTPAAVLMNVTSEPTALAVRLPLVKGFYDEGDSIEGYRIVYFTVSEILLALFKSIFFTGLYLLGFVVDHVLLLQLSFVFAAVATVITLIQKFPALKRV